MTSLRPLFLISAMALGLGACSNKPSQAQLDDTRQHALFARDPAALQQLERWAAADDADAQRTLAETLAEPATPEAWRKARPWFERAARLGDAHSAFRLARIYAKGLGTPVNPALSEQWLVIAADRKQADARCLLGLHAKSPVNGKPDLARANHWFELAAEQGSAEAMFQLGIAYQEGIGVVRDIAKARDWYEKAARKEMPAALQTLAMAYENGDLGVKQDHIKASELFNLAAHAVHDFESELF